MPSKKVPIERTRNLVFAGWTGIAIIGVSFLLGLCRWLLLSFASGTSLAMLVSVIYAVWMLSLALVSVVCVVLLLLRVLWKKLSHGSRSNEDLRTVVLFGAILLLVWGATLSGGDGTLRLRQMGLGFQTLIEMVGWSMISGATILQLIVPGHAERSADFPFARKRG